MQIVTTHKGTDFDALASLIAATMIYPDAVPVLPKSVNANVRAFMAIHKDLFKVLHPKEINLDEVTHLIVVDTNSWKRLDGFSPLKDRDDLTIHLWDHHDGGDIKADQVRNDGLGSTVTHFILELEARRMVLTPILATLFLIGIYEDTGSLSYPSTRPEDARAVAWLLDRKADLNVLGGFLKQVYGEKQKSVLFEMMKNPDRRKVNGYTLSFASVPIEGHVANLSVVVNMFLDLENSDGAFGVFYDEEGNKCMIIGRSKVESLDVGKLMRTLGGGGHPGAGATQFKSDFHNPDAVFTMICNLVENDQVASVQLGDIMSFPVVSVETTTLMEELGALLRERGCTGVPVTDHGKVVGVISRRDFKKIRKETQMKSPVKAYMTPSVVQIESEKSPLEAARLMIKHDIGRVPVVQNGEMIGIVTRTDVMRYYYDLIPD
ncbi:CBS domain-containing protein [Desulfoluna sp.]|uniref:CBS domain-containing protein n=1 Tax=Desulfoluna sp. TaxID=2045199 RepID=UPI00262E3E24|nr:CBS domain-containing protein [Desulfoluna sp.]